jgi:hypothetical protein
VQEPERLLANGATDFERKLLEAVQDERPSAELQQRMQRALGLPGGAAPTVTSPEAPSVQPSASAVLGSGLQGVALKVILGAIVAGGLAYPVVLLTTASSERSEPARAAKREGTTRSAPQRAGLPAPPAAESSGAEPSEATPRAAPEQARADEAPHDAPRAPTDRDSLRLEIELLDAVRAASLRGESDRAQQVLEGYDRRFPRGALQREADMLRRSGKATGAAPSAPSRGVDPEPASGR